VAGGYSNRTRATKFNPTSKKRRQPNLQWVTLPGGLPAGKADGRRRICTKCLKKDKHLVPLLTKKAQA
jgi:ribosomal protein L28